MTLYKQLYEGRKIQDGPAVVNWEELFVLMI